MPEKKKNWYPIVKELRGLKNRIVAMESSPDDDFLYIVDKLEEAACDLTDRYSQGDNWY